MNIVILDDYQNVVSCLDCFHKLQAHQVRVFHDTCHDVDRLAARLQDADALVLIRQRTPITAQLLEKLPRLKLISQTSRAGKHIDLQACRQHGVAVTEGRGSPIAPAELTWALIMAATRRLPQYLQELHQGHWQQNNLPTQLALGQVLHGRTLGIWGYGKIGHIVASYARAFGMQIMIWGSERSRQKAQDDGLKVAHSKRKFFATADIVTLHLRLVPETRNLITAEDLSHMKPTAILVNTARSELIEAGALSAALSRGRPGMAAVDVYDSEPIAADHDLVQKPNCIASPHIGYVEKDNYESYFSEAFDNVVNFFEGRPCQRVDEPA